MYVHPFVRLSELDKSGSVEVEADDAEMKVLDGVHLKFDSEAAELLPTVIRFCCI